MSPVPVVVGGVHLEERELAVLESTGLLWKFSFLFMF